MGKQYYSKTKKKWVNFTNEDYGRESELVKYKYRIRQSGLQGVGSGLQRAATKKPKKNRWGL